ncbi:membrane associated rhomboid family serine protease [Parabacteroides sp. PM5-20]|nr:membrane associated rhomboid family serine protease [Parabacteroides sp. PM5-20]
MFAGKYNELMMTYLIIITTLFVSFSCFSQANLFMKLAFVPYRVVRNKEWYRMITHGFVHADSLHLLVNMFTFYSFGTEMERMFGYMGFGPLAFIGLYLGGILAASIPDLLQKKNQPNYVSIGASGAVSAVLFAYILFNPWRSVLLFAILPVPGILFGVLYLIYCQYMVRKGGGSINHKAHFYGAIFGFLYPLFLEPGLLPAFLSHFGL